jgi:hypothetical protein
LLFRVPWEWIFYVRSVLVLISRLEDGILRQERSVETLNNNGHYACCGFFLIPGQQARLQDFLENRISATVADPSITSLTEHRIDVGQHSPIKQRCYVISFSKGSGGDSRKSRQNVRGKN